MPPTNMVPPGGWGQAPVVEDPLASASDTFYHNQYKQLLLRLRQMPVMILVGRSSGVGKSHMLRQAAEQLVLSKQLVFVPNAYVAQGLHPSIEYAWRHGGMVVVSDTTSQNVHMSLRFANQVLSNNQCLNLDDPERPDRHPGFRYVVELTTEVEIPKHNNPVLRAVEFKAEHCDMLYSNLACKIFPTQKSLTAFLTLRQGLPEAERNNLHLLDFFTSSLLLPGEQADCMEELIRGHSGSLTIAQGEALDELRREKGSKSRPRTVLEPPASEQDSPEQQATALRQVVQEFEHPTPTVRPSGNPVAEIAGIPVAPDTDPLLGF